MLLGVPAEVDLACSPWKPDQLLPSKKYIPFKGNLHATPKGIWQRPKLHAHTHTHTHTSAKAQARGSLFVRGISDRGDPQELTADQIID